MEMMDRNHRDERELDARFIELFRSAERIDPGPDFVAKTMDAVRAASLPAGRQRLRKWWAAPLGWAALVSAAATITIAIITEPVAARTFASLMTFALHTGVQLAHLSVASLAFTDLFATIGVAVARAAATREGIGALIITTGMAAGSITALQRLLTDREGSPWQELS
jgi:hypothetical protein